MTDQPHVSLALPPLKDSLVLIG